MVLMKIQVFSIKNHLTEEDKQLYWQQESTTEYSV